MIGTVQQFLDALEEMRSIYPFENNKTVMSDFNIINQSHDSLEIHTVDEKTGISIVMAKRLRITI